MGGWNRMAALDTWTDAHVEESIRLLVQAEMLVRIDAAREQDDARTRRAAFNFLRDVSKFLLEMA